MSNRITIFTYSFSIRWMDLLWPIALVGLWWFFLAIFVLEDAQKRGRTQLWGFATLVFGIFALFPYLLSREGTQEVNPTLRCTDCNWIYYKQKRANRHEHNTGHTVEVE